MESLQQVALIIASLPQREAADLLVRLPEDVVERISRFTPGVETIDRQQQEHAATALAQAMRGRGSQPLEAVRGTEVLAQSIARQALREVDLRRLTMIMAGEIPQTVAIVLQALEIDRAAELLARLPTHQQMAVVQRMTCGCHVDRELLGDLISDLVWDSFSGPLGETRGLDTIARMLLRLDHATEQALLENLRHEQPEMVDQVLQVKLILQDLENMDRPSEFPRDDLVDEVLKLHAQEDNTCNEPLAGVPRAA